MSPIGVNNYVVIITVTSPSITSTARLMSQTGFNNWASDNKSILSVAGNTYTTSFANYRRAVGNSTNGIWNLGNSRYYNPPNPAPIAPGTILRDMGQDRFIGVPGQANLLHLRLVELPGTVENSGLGGAIGYVVVEGNANIFNGTTYPNVSVARV